MKRPSPLRRMLPMLVWTATAVLPAATPGVLRHFEGFAVDDRTRLPRFFREIPMGKLEGHWRSAWAVEGKEALLDSRFSPTGKRPHYAVRYDELARPITVEGWNLEKPFALSIEWKEGWPVAMVWRRLDANRLEAGVETWEIERNPEGAVRLVRIGRQGYTAWAESYHARAGELLIVGQFPGGGLREIRLYAGGQKAGEALRLKERRYRVENATFETLPATIGDAEARKAPRLHDALRLDGEEGFRAVMGLSYVDFSEVDRETIWEDGADPWNCRALIRERGALPRVECRRENRLESIATLEKMATYSNAAQVPAGIPFSGFSDGQEFWGDYIVAEFGIDPRGARVERRYQDGLLRQTSWLDADGEAKRVALDYYPDRTKNRERTWIRGERVDVRLFRCGDQAELPPRGSNGTRAVAASR